MKEKYVKSYKNNRHSLNKFLDLSDLREKAIEQFEKQGFPNSKNEKWRNFDLKEFEKIFFNPFVVQNEMNLKFFNAIPGFEESELFVLYNGFSSFEMQLDKFKNGVIFGSLRAAMNNYPELVNSYCNKINKQYLNGFNSLNTAFCFDGFFLYVPDNTKVDIPFSIVNYYKNTVPDMVATRNIVVLGKNAEVNIVQVEMSDEHDMQFVNSITEVFLDENSKLEWDSMQKYRGKTIAINPVFIHQKEKSGLYKTVSTLRGHKIRNDIHCKLTGENCNADINGLYITNGNDLIENQVFLDHAVPNCDSNQFFKGILNGKSRGAFTGYVLVRQDSQKTNAFQSNKNIIISDDAVVHTNPFLEIYADDVKCSHGASVGNLDENALFYMRTRGLDEKEAKDILLSAFALEVLNNMKNIDFKKIISSEIEKTLLHN